MTIPGRRAVTQTDESGSPNTSGNYPGVPTTFTGASFTRVGLFISDGQAPTSAPTELSITDSRQPNNSGAAQLTLSHGSTPVETVSVPDGHRVEVPTTPLYIIDAHPAGAIDDMPHPELLNADTARRAQIRTHDGYDGFQLTASSHLDASGGFQLQNTTAQNVDVSVTGVDIPYRAGDDVGSRSSVELPGEVGWRVAATTDGASAKPVTVESSDAVVTLTSNGDLPTAPDFREILHVHG